MGERKLNEKEIRGFWTFLVETFEFTEEQTDAIHHQIPMTQALYDSILDKCEEIGPNSDRLFYSMLEEYPDFMEARADKITREVETADIPPMPDGVKERIKKNFDEEIRKRFGENAI